MRILAVDYGEVRTGLCVSDRTGTLPGEAWVVEEWNAQALARRIADEAAAREAERIVLGLPKTMDGTAERSRALAALLEQAGAPPVVLWDERRSSVEAHAILHAAGKKEKKHRRNVDAVAASLILEGYLRSL